VRTQRPLKTRLYAFLKTSLYCYFVTLPIAGETTLLHEPLDGAEKRRSEAFVCRCSAWVPVTHASVTPLRNVFRTDAARAARKVRFRSMFPPGI
jgi:hypothetical protein